MGQAPKPWQGASLEAVSPGVEVLATRDGPGPCTAGLWPGQDGWAAPLPWLLAALSCLTLPGNSWSHVWCVWGSAWNPPPPPVQPTILAAFLEEAVMCSEHKWALGASVRSVQAPVSVSSCEGVLLGRRVGVMGLRVYFSGR